MTPRELVKVKELTWHERTIPVDGLYYVAYVNGWTYQALWSGQWQLFNDDADTIAEGKAFNIDQARAACQAHYENSIYEQLEPISFINRGDAVSPTP